LQEVRGLFFLFLKNFNFQLIIIFLKIGVSPLHFWVFSILIGLRINLVFWFLTFQKLVYFSILVSWSLNFIYFFFLGIFVCFIQVIFLFDFLKVFIINLTERINWILLFFIRSLNESFILIIYYLGLSIILLKNSLRKKILNWVVILFLVNLPLSLNFFVKIFILLNLSVYNLFFLFFIIFFIIIRIFGLIKILFNLNLNLVWKRKLNKNFYLIIFQFLILFYYFSKIKIILSW
jgi:hypothetical protein